MEIAVDLNKKAEYGLPEWLQCLGFHSDFAKKQIHVFYARCVRGLDGKLVMQDQHQRTFTNNDKRQDTIVSVDANGAPVVAKRFDENGAPVMIGVFDYWEKTVGNNIIYPDLQEVMNGIGVAQWGAPAQP